MVSRRPACEPVSLPARFGDAAGREPARICFAGRFEPYTDPILVTRYIGSAGFVGWFDAATGLVLEYALTYEKAPATPYVTNGYDELAHSFLVEAYVRFP